MPKTVVTATEYLMGLFKEADKIAEDAATKMHATCRKGCTHCCGLLATITIADGFVLAEGLLNRPDWEEWLPKLVAAAKQYCYHGISKESWFRKKNMCVFLKDGACSVYERRPAACRYHYVISDPKNCSPDMPPDTATAMLDLITLEAQTSWKVAQELIDFPVSGPIPLLTLHCMEQLAAIQPERWPGRLETLEKFAKQVPNPFEWMATYANELFHMSKQEMTNFITQKGVGAVKEIASIIKSKT